MLQLELSDEQDKWAHNTDTESVYEDADLPTDPDAPLSGDDEEGV